MKMPSPRHLVAAALVGTAMLPLGQVSAAPLGPAAGHTIQQSHELMDGRLLSTVQYRRRSGAAAGAFIAGAIVGGVIASQVWPIYPYYGPYPVDPYYPPYAYYPAPAYGGAVAYCVRRFRSYDPRTMTYLGYDGRRHSCP